MCSSMQPYREVVGYETNWVEQVILQLADAFDIRVLWDRDTAIMTGALALAGGIIGGYSGGRLGAALGAGIGSATGYGVSTLVRLRDIWDTVKEKLKELVFIVLNYLRRLDPVDYAHAFEVLMACTASRRELVLTLLDVIANKLGREVFSSITAGAIAAHIAAV